MWALLPSPVTFSMVTSETLVHRSSAKIVAIRGPREVEPLLQAPVELEAIARGGDERSLDDVRALAVRILGDETDTVSHAKPAGIGRRDLLMLVVAVHDESGGGRRLHE